MNGHQPHARPYILTTVTALCAVLLSTACAYQSVFITVSPNTMLIVQGGRATLTVTTSEPRCPADDPRPCVDITGHVFDYVVQNLPDGVSYAIDTGLQSPSTPGTVRMTFTAAAHTIPGNHYVAVIHATVAGRSVGQQTVPLHVLAAGGTTPASEPVSISAAETYSVAALADGSVRSWGRNDYGQLGIGDRSSRSVPTVVRTLDGIGAVAAGDEHALALTVNGRVWAWGRNDRGQLGLGFTSQRVFGGEHSPREVEGVHNVVAISVGWEHSLALREGGSVAVWGSNASGKLGTGDRIDRNQPVLVQGLPPARAVAAGSNYSLAVDREGFVWIWGDTTLGDDGITTSVLPIQVPGLSNIQTVATRNGSALALDRDGRVWGWGRNNGGELGDGTTTNRLMPVQVQGPENVVAIAIGNFHGLALTSDGRVWAWGGNTVGQLGIGEASTGPSLPVLVPGLTSVRAIAAGANHSFGLLRCGQLWVWGSNFEGQQGDGSGEPNLAPIPLPGLGNDAECDTVSLRVTLAGDAGLVSNAVATSVGELRRRGAEWVAYLPRGTNVELTAQPELVLSDRRVVFEGWAIDCQGTETQTSLLLDRSKSCAGRYTATSFAGALLSVITNGGRVTSSGGGILGPQSIDCGATCNAIFPEGTTVTLTAVSTNGFEFLSWTGDCSGTDPVATVVMDGPKTCDARFRPYRLDVAVAGSGTVTSDPAGIDCGAECSFTPGTGSVELLATPAAGWQFDGWSGDCTGTTRVVTVVMDGDKSCTATFSRTPGLFFVTMVIEGQGSVTSDPPGIACPPDCVGLFPAGTSLNLTAEPAPNFSLFGWFDDCAAPATSVNTLVVGADTQCRVRFLGDPTITVAEFSSAPQDVRVGRVITFDGNQSHVFDPVTGTRDLAAIRSWAWDFTADGTFEVSGGRTAAAIAQYAFQSAGDHTARLRVVGGVFDLADDEFQMVAVAPNTLPLFPLTASKAGTGQGSIASEPAGLIRCEATCMSAGPIQLEAGTTVTLVATPGNGHQFDSWAGCDTVSGDRCTVVMNGARTPTATFSPVAAMFTLSAVVNAPPGSRSFVHALQPPGSQFLCTASGEPVCSESFAPGTVVVLRPDSLTLETGGFIGWSGCDSVGPLFACSVTMTNDRMVTANFSQ